MKLPKWQWSYYNYQHESQKRRQRIGYFGKRSRQDRQDFKILSKAGQYFGGRNKPEEKAYQAQSPGGKGPSHPGAGAHGCLQREIFVPQMRQSRAYWL